MQIFFKFTACFLLLFLPFFAVQAQVEERENQRSLLVLWQEEQVFGSGVHRPYAQLVLKNEDGTTLWEGNANARGEFEFTLAGGVLSADRDQRLSVSAFDQFEREIRKSDGTFDSLQAFLPAKTVLAESAAPVEAEAVAAADEISENQPVAAAPVEESKNVFLLTLMVIGVIGGLTLGIFLLVKRRMSDV